MGTGAGAGPHTRSPVLRPEMDDSEEAAVLGERWAECARWTSELVLGEHWGQVQGWGYSSGAGIHPTNHSHNVMSQAILDVTLHSMVRGSKALFKE